MDLREPGRGGFRGFDRFDVEEACLAAALGEVGHAALDRCVGLGRHFPLDGRPGLRERLGSLRRQPCDQRDGRLRRLGDLRGLVERVDRRGTCETLDPLAVLERDEVLDVVSVVNVVLDVVEFALRRLGDFPRVRGIGRVDLELFFLGHLGVDRGLERQALLAKRALGVPRRFGSPHVAIVGEALRPHADGSVLRDDDDLTAPRGRGQHVEQRCAAHRRDLGEALADDNRRPGGRDERRKCRGEIVRCHRVQGERRLAAGERSADAGDELAFCGRQLDLGLLELLVETGTL